jgi:alpha-amylase/alpha-mannosidase (GH57 family)
MNGRVSLLLGVHAHQPVGNFPEVLDDAHARCYRPFLQTLHRYPGFRFAVHFSGWLLEYLFDKYPEDMGLLREMVERGQVEMFGGGDTEPVLAVIPGRDRIGQVTALSDRLARLTHRRPSGAWLTERVWEATVVPALADAGIQYATVDDYHFLCAGKDPAELAGYYTTEEDGRRVDLFPISEGLRYRIPFAPAQETVSYIERMAESGNPAAAIYFDDIEKLGIWPDTHAWVYEKKWLEQFIEGVLASPAIKTEHFAAFRNVVPTRGVIYLPTTSYIEMNEWTLPAGRAHAYANLVKQEKDHARYERDKAFIRGGIWKNFLSRYAESNWMHKRMLALSSRLHTLPASQRSAELTALLYQAQANDAYWHGLFGGLYLPHLRRAVYNAIVSLEGKLDQLAPRLAIQRHDADLDGVQEIFLHNDVLQAVVREDGDAAVIELDSYSLHHNFGDTLARREEHYYRKLSLGEQAQAQSGGIASAHDRVRLKHAISPSDVEPDTRARSLFLDTWAADPAGPGAAPRYERDPASEGIAAVFRATLPQGALQKQVSLNDNRLTIRYSFGAALTGRFDTQINLAMPSADGFLGRYVHEGSIPGGFGQSIELASVTTLALEDGVLGGTLEVLCSPPVRLTGRPHHTVSQSEDGFEKIMQAVTLDLSWAVGDDTTELVVALEIRREWRQR